jgi:hypothetical protein
MQYKHLFEDKIWNCDIFRSIAENEMMKVGICFKNFLNVNITLFDPNFYLINQIIVFWGNVKQHRVNEKTRYVKQRLITK